MTDFQRKIFGIIILATIAVLTIATLVAPKKAFSESENRKLAESPKPSFETIKDGTWMEDVESYISDHFVFRDTFMTARTKYELLTGRNSVNGIYLCDDGYFIEEYKEPENTDRIELAIRRLERGIKNARLHIMLVPTAVTVYADKLPATAKNADQLAELAKITEYARKEAGTDKVSCNVDFVNVYEELMRSRDEEQLFYRLDHHWTSAGAYIGYTAYCRTAGLTPAPLSDFEAKTVTDSFRGTFHSKLNDPSAMPDSIVAFYSKSADYEVTYIDGAKESTADSPFSEKYLSGKDKYSFFLDNQHSFAKIVNKAAPADKVLVLVKDSYANCMIPFLAENYGTIIAFDTRYYFESVVDYVNTHEEVTDVLFLYNLCTIDTDTGIPGIR